MFALSVWSLSMTIGHRIKKAREGLKMSQDELAAAIGVTRPAVSQWEDGTSNPRSKRIPSIAEALGADPVWLTHGTKRKGAAQMPVRGEVAAGSWREAFDDLELKPVSIAPTKEYPEDSQYALLVKGNSLNKIAKDSEYLHVVDCYNGETRPRPGDVVVVLRKRHGTTEATVKRLVERGGKLFLKAESTDPQWQGELQLGAKDDETEIVISAIVIGKYEPISRGHS
jgi:SOS-response transcriptional repressor LexA